MSLPFVVTCAAVLNPCPMKYLVASSEMESVLMPSVQMWLDHQLQSRGIGSMIYARHIIQLLQQEDTEDGDYANYFEIRGKKNQAARKTSKKKSKEERKKSAAIEYLQAIFDDNADIEVLVDQLFLKLKETSTEVTKAKPLNVGTEDSSSSEGISDSSISPELSDPTQRYYAAFPALQPENNEQTTSELSPYREDSVDIWKHNPITNQLLVPGSPLKPSSILDHHRPFSHEKKVGLKKKKNKINAVKHNKKIKQSRSRTNSFCKSQQQGSCVRVCQYPNLQTTYYYTNMVPSSYGDATSTFDEEELCCKVESVLKEILFQGSSDPPPGDNHPVDWSDINKGRDRETYKTDPPLSESERLSPEFQEKDAWYTQPLEDLFVADKEDSHPGRLYKRKSLPTFEKRMTDELQSSQVYSKYKEIEAETKGDDESIDIAMGLRSLVKECCQRSCEGPEAGPLIDVDDPVMDREDLNRPGTLPGAEISQPFCDNALPPEPTVSETTFSQPLDPENLTCFHSSTIISSSSFLYTLGTCSSSVPGLLSEGTSHSPPDYRFLQPHQLPGPQEAGAANAWSYQTTDFKEFKLWNVNYQKPDTFVEYPWRCAADRDHETSTSCTKHPLQTTEKTASDSHLGGCDVEEEEQASNTLIPVITVDMTQHDPESVQSDVPCVRFSMNRSVSFNEYDLRRQRQEISPPVSNPQLSRSFDLVPSEYSAFDGVVPGRMHHVKSEPNLKSSFFLSTPLASPKSLKENFRLEGEKSSKEHLYFSPKTHFQPIQSPCSPASDDSLSDYHLRDLFGGYSKTSKTPYQKFQAGECPEDQEAEFVPMFKIKKEHDKYIQTAGENESLCVICGKMPSILPGENGDMANHCSCEEEPSVMEDFDVLGLVDSLTTSECNTPQNDGRDLRQLQTYPDSGYEELDISREYLPQDPNVRKTRDACPFEYATIETSSGEKETFSGAEGWVMFLGGSHRELYPSEEDSSVTLTQHPPLENPHVYDYSVTLTEPPLWAEEKGTCDHHMMWWPDAAQGACDSQPHWPEEWSNNDDMLPGDDAHFYQANCDNQAFASYDGASFINEGLLLPSLFETGSDSCFISEETGKEYMENVNTSEINSDISGSEIPMEIKNSNSSQLCDIEQMESPPLKSSPGENVTKIKLVFRKTKKVTEPASRDMVTVTTASPADGINHDPGQKNQSSEFGKKNNKQPKGLKKKPCSFYMEGSCKRMDCKFAHDLSQITCRFWMEGTCFKGEICPFLHGYYSEEAVERSSPVEALDVHKYFFRSSEFPELPLASQQKPATSSAEKPEYVTSRKVYRRSQTKSSDQSKFSAAYDLCKRATGHGAVSKKPTKTKTTVSKKNSQTNLS